MNPKVIINFVMFQLAWFACVIGAAKGYPSIGLVVTFAAVIWHLYNAHHYRAELLLLLIAFAIGATFDQTLLSNHLVDYAHHGWGENSLNSMLVPTWILALWVGFATSLNVSLRWMHDKYLVAIIFGAIGGPVAYMAAEKLGAVTLNTTTSYFALSIGWAIITPMLLIISSKFDGYQAINKAESAPKLAMSKALKGLK